MQQDHDPAGDFADMVSDSPVLSDDNVLAIDNPSTPGQTESVSVLGIRT